MKIKTSKNFQLNPLYIGMNQSKTITPNPFDPSKNCKFFPSDFFTEPTLEKKRSQSIESDNIKNKLEEPKKETTKTSKSIIVDLRKEYEEVKEIIDLLDGKPFTSHNACRKNILKEIEENENEEDSFGRNESQMKQNKNDTENQSDIYFNQNNKINFNNNERGEKDYNAKGVLNFKENNGKKYKLKINTDLFERNEKDIFNNYISHTPKNLLENANKLYTINYLNSFNNKDNLSNNNIKPSLNYFWTQKKNASSKVKIIDDNLRDKILKVKANENNQKVSLPKLNNDIKETKRSLTSNQKKRNLYTDGNIPSTIIIFVFIIFFYTFIIVIFIGIDIKFFN